MEKNNKGGFDSLLDSLGKLIDMASELKGGETRQGEGEIDLSNIKDGMKAMYGFRLGSLSGGIPTVETFGNVRNTEQGPKVEEEREPMTDVFDEESEIKIYAEMPGVEESQIEVAIEGNQLIIKANNSSRNYRKVLSLSANIDSASLSSQYKNGILEISIKKA